MEDGEVHKCNVLYQAIPYLLQYGLNRSMAIPTSPSEIPESERTPLVEWLLNIVAQQQQVIEQQQETISQLEAKVAQLEEQVGHLDEQLKASKKLKGKPKILPSQAQPSGGGDRQVRETSRFR